MCSTSAPSIRSSLLSSILAIPSFRDLERPVKPQSRHDIKENVNPYEPKVSPPCAVGNMKPIKKLIRRSKWTVFANILRCRVEYQATSYIDVRSEEFFAGKVPDWSHSEDLAIGTCYV